MLSYWRILAGKTECRFHMLAVAVFLVIYFSSWTAGVTVLSTTVRKFPPGTAILPIIYEEGILPYFLIPFALFSVCPRQMDMKTIG